MKRKMFKKGILSKDDIFRAYFYRELSIFKSKSFFTERGHFDGEID